MLCVQLLVHVCHAMCLEIRDQFPGAGSGLLSAESGVLVSAAVLHAHRWLPCHLQGRASASASQLASGMLGLHMHAT